MYVKDILRRGSCWWCWWRCWWWYFPSAHLPCIRTLLCPSWWPVFLGDATTVPGKFAVCPGDGELESFWGVTMMILWIQNAMFGLEIFNQPKSDGDLTKITWKTWSETYLLYKIIGNFWIQKTVCTNREAGLPHFYLLPPCVLEVVLVILSPKCLVGLV